METKQIVLEYLDIFFGDKFNPDILKPLLKEDFTFKGPLMTANSSDEFIAKIKTFGENIEMNGEIHKVVCDGNTVVVQYDFILPNNNSVCASEWYEIKDNKISKMHLFCDPKGFLTDF